MNQICETDCTKDIFFSIFLPYFVVECFPFSLDLKSSNLIQDFRLIETDLEQDISEFFLSELSSTQSIVQTPRNWYSLFRGF